MRIEARGADDGVEAIGGTLVDIFKNGFEDAAEFAFAAVEQARGMRVAIDGGAVGDLVALGDLAWAVPADEVTFDGVTIGMRANDAAAGVTGEIGR